MYLRSLVFTACALLFSSGWLSAQVNRCATMEADSMLRARNPKMESMQDFENWMQQTLQQNPGGNPTLMPNVRTIPVVVHVIYSNASENISLAQIQSQIDILNEDFRRLNGDTTNTPAMFQPVAGDMLIEFCLARTDPNGNLTDGVNRVPMAGSPFSMNDFESGIKAATQWDPNQYFNIWVANLSGGLLGYAQFPNSTGLPGLNNNNGAANTDGVVLLASSVGRPPQNPNPGPYNLGRTATHEVGHWLGLRHIWGDGNCNVDDFCNDTPVSDGSNFGCPTTHVSCNTTDMVQNYMDYTEDACMNLFTMDQKARMDVVLDNSPRRTSLLSSTVCNIPTGVYANFDGTPRSGCVPLTVQFTDQSNGPIVSWMWDFGDGNTSTQQNPSHTYLSGGLYSVTLIVSDGTNTDTLTQVDYITVSGAGAGQPLPFTEDFESASFATNAWTLENPDNASTWEIFTVGGITPGDKAARVPCFSYASRGQRDGMVTRDLDLSGLVSAEMTFDHAHRKYNNTYTDSLNVYISTSCGGTWIPLLQLAENGTRNFATNSNTTTNFVPSQGNHWCFQGNWSGCFTVDLTPYVGNPNVKIKFEVVNDYGNNIYVDNINITGVQGQAAPVAGFGANTTSICAGSNVAFTDASTNNPTGWSWDFGDGNGSAAQNPNHTYTTAGNYTVSLIANNAAGSDTVIQTNYITVNPNPTVAGTMTPDACSQGNGTATANAAGGQPGYTYLWSNGGTTATITGLASGGYTVTVTDQNGCVESTTVTVGTVGAPTAQVPSVNHTSCGQANGSATVSASGGTPGYSYLWSNGAITATASGLAAGNYTVTVTDQNGCTDVVTTTINPSAGPSATATAAPAACQQATGSASVNATAGTPGYTYLWSNGGTTATITGLAAGSYTVTVTDAAGCTTTATANVGNLGGPAAQVSTVQHTSCGNANGAATVTATGGTPGYSYLWSNGATTASITGLASGTYTVTVTDQNNCQDVTTVTINPSASPIVVVSPTGTSCGAANGQATANVTAGTPGYTYLWSTGATTPTVTGLAAGAVSVTVTDAAGCTSVQTANIQGSSAPVVSVPTVQHTSCGQANGSATAAATNGTPGYTYVWSNNQNGATASNLAAGTYSVVVTDASGCQDSVTVTINPSTAVSVQTTGSDEICGQSNGLATASPSGGTPGYSYLWSNGGTGATIGNLPAGTYTVTVTDAAGCTSTGSYVVNAIAGPTVASMNAVNVSCAGGADGSGTAMVTGGAPAYTYVWSDGQTTNPATGLAPGSYTVTVTDANGCSDVNTLTITAPAALQASVTATDETTPGAADGTATANVSGGTAPYTYAWSDGQTTNPATGLAPGAYTVTVTDANGCDTLMTFEIGTATALTQQAEIGMDVFPNPNQGSFTVAFDLPYASDVRMSVRNALGQEIYFQELNGVQAGEQKIRLGSVADGIYFVELRANGMRAVRRIQKLN